MPVRVLKEEKAGDNDNNNLPRGIVKWYNHRKRFGYIKSSEGQTIFFHFASVRKTNPQQIFLQGDRVHYKLVQGARGLKAVEVAKVGFKASKKKKEKKPPAKIKFPSRSAYYN